MCPFRLSGLNFSKNTIKTPTCVKKRLRRFFSMLWCHHETLWHHHARIRDHRIWVFRKSRGRKIPYNSPNCLKIAQNLVKIPNKLPWQFHEDSVRNGGKLDNRVISVDFSYICSESQRNSKNTLNVVRIAWKSQESCSEYLRRLLPSFMKIRWETEEIWNTAHS